MIDLKSKTFLSMLSLMIGLTSISNSQAALITEGQAMRDTDSGLLWLQVELTTNMSYSAVTASSHMTSDGYRFATEAELLQLYANVGAQNPPQANFSAEHFAAVRTLNDTWGMNHLGGGQNAVIGMVVNSVNEWVAYRSIYYLCCNLSGKSFQDYGTVNAYDGYNSGPYGFYLVQGDSGAASAVEISTTPALLLFGLTTLFGRQCYRSRLANCRQASVAVKIPAS